MLGLDTQLLGLFVDLNVVDLFNTTLLIGLVTDPFAQLVIDGVTTALAFLIVIFAVEHELGLEVVRERLLASLDGLGTHIDSPIVVVHLDLTVETLSLGLDLASQEVVVASILKVLVGVAVGRGLVRVVVASGAIVFATILLLGLAGSLAVGLVFLAGLLGLVLEDEAAELQTQVNVGALAASLAVQSDVAVLDLDIGLGVLALLAKNELLDETVQIVLELV